VTETFFTEQTEQSLIKATLVTKYFPAYMRVIASVQRKHGGDRIAYIDLFCGPGRYENGAASTPEMIIKQAIGDPDMRNRLVAIFNDKDEKNIQSLKETLEALDGYSTLKHKPQIEHGEVGEEIVSAFESMKLVPTLFFVDPWGYKGMTLRLINSVLKDWGCDGFFFFNYGRINAGLANDKVEKHMDSLFGADRAASLRARFEDRKHTPAEREAFIVEEMCEALKEMGGRFVLPFRFHNQAGTRITHHLFFVSKDFKGYEIMKDIMHTHSTGKHDGVVNFEYNPADQRQPTLFNLRRPVEELGGLLQAQFAGKTMGIRDVYEAHSVGTPYVLKHYRKVLCQMEQEGKITIDPPCPPRRCGTVAPTAKISFQPKP
jgi:three-Cys-motif partner protein